MSHCHHVDQRQRLRQVDLRYVPGQNTDHADGAGIGLVPDLMTSNWDHEALYHGFYRVWKERLLAAAAA